MAKGTNILKNRTDYTRSYRDIRGVELNGSATDISAGRFAYMENMYRDYEGDSPGAIESVPGFRKLYSFGERINAIYMHKAYPAADCLVIHAGRALYRFHINSMDRLRPLTKIADLYSDKSSSFSFGSDLYILDGKRILRIDSDGNALEVGKELPAYVPTLYYNGSPYEQRNLLTDNFTEKHKISDPSLYSYTTPGLKYEITDPSNLYCSVVGIDASAQGRIEIPGTVRLGDYTYRVTEIADSAFSGNTAITSLKIGEGVERIGKLSFYCCGGLTSVSLPSTVSLIDNGAFADCTGMKEIYVGRGLEKIGTSAFATCYNISYVYYGGTREKFEEIEGVNQLNRGETVYGRIDTSFTAMIRCASRPTGIERVTINGVEREFNPEFTDGKIDYLTMNLSGAWEISGALVEISGTLSPYYSTFTGSKDEGIGILGTEAVFGCRISEPFDDRIFLSGNEKLPNTVFYTARDDSGANNPLYIGVYNYFNDGVGKYPVISMLAVRDSLGVFKAGDDGCGSIFYHTPRETKDSLLPKVYPTSYVHSGLCAGGKAISFLDDPVFVSKEGVCALDQKAINYERSIACRSHNVNYDLLKENLADVCLTEWRGYLVVGVNGRIFLADSRATFTHRTGNREYEWFYLCDVGTYQNSTRVYRYASFAPEGYELYKRPDTVCQSTVMSVSLDGETVYYSEEDGKKYALYCTEEETGGEFSPAVTFFGCDDLLFFGTESGDLAVFNNDKRGIAPDRIKNTPDFDNLEYKKVMGRKIHADFYSFAGRAVRYAVKTAFDDCGIPHATKSTSKHSLCLKLKSFGGSEITVAVYTDKGEYLEPTSLSSCEFDFSEIDFSKISFSTEDHFTLQVSEKEKNWIEKQIAVYSESFRSPIGVYSITYRYTPSGRIKNK